jgi:hypothetical protein
MEVVRATELDSTPLVSSDDERQASPCQFSSLLSQTRVIPVKSLPRSLRKP